jgi:hypothetical protein
MSTDTEALATALHAQRLLGRTPARAMATLAALPKSLTGLNRAHVCAATLGAMLNRVYAGDISARDTAVILRDTGYALGDVALALRAAWPAMAALDTGIILLDPRMGPGPARADLVAALAHAGYQPRAIALAARILFPVTVTVRARDGWQSTGIIVDAQQTTTIACQGGSWTVDPAHGGCDGAGYPAWSAGPACPLPAAPTGSLVGRIGATHFLVGNVTTVPAGLEGSLELCINDNAATPDLAGKGGRLMVRISMKIPVKSDT